MGKIEDLLSSRTNPFTGKPLNENTIQNNIITYKKIDSLFEINDSIDKMKQMSVRHIVNVCEKNNLLDEMIYKILYIFKVVTGNEYKFKHILQKYKEKSMDRISKKKVSTINQSDVGKIYESLNDDLDKLILGLYYLNPPRRRMDYEGMKVHRKGALKDLDLSFNYIDLPRKQFIFNQYKTSKKYGQQKIPIHPELLKLIKKVLKLNENYFDNINKSKIYNTLKKFDLTPTKLRHIRCNEVYKNLDVKEAIETAKAMGHSVEVAMMVYSRN